MTEEFDVITMYRVSDLPVYAAHCPKCGRWAHVVRGDDGARGYWMVTDCAQCGLWHVSGSPIGSPLPKAIKEINP